MDEPGLRRFYSRCDAAHREWFSTLIHAWTEAGQPWSCDGREVTLCARMARRTPYPGLFALRGRDGMVAESVRLRPAVWRETLGEADAGRVLAGLQAVEGLSWDVREGELLWSGPGHASGPSRRQWGDRVQALALRLRVSAGD